MFFKLKYINFLRKIIKLFLVKKIKFLKIKSPIKILIKYKKDHNLKNQILFLNKKFFLRYLVKKKIVINNNYKC